MLTNIRAIEIFARAVEGGSFVAAARSLLTDPATVSRAIKGLEESLGVSLFARSTRVLKFTPKLTADGEALREAALASCGIIRTYACNIDDQLRSEERRVGKECRS